MLSVLVAAEARQRHQGGQAQVRQGGLPRLPLLEQRGAQRSIQPQRGKRL
jgi:hypothetical protein